MKPATIIVESPLSGDFERNKRFAAWCCRAIWEVEGAVAIASHLIAPQYLDDTVPEEREAGWGMDVCWRGDQHWFFEDLGIVSGGMKLAAEKCKHMNLQAEPVYLSYYHPPSFAAFERGEWPPCTPGFGPSELDKISAQLNEGSRIALLEFAASLLEDLGIGEDI